MDKLKAAIIEVFLASPIWCWVVALGWASLCTWMTDGGVLYWFYILACFKAGRIATVLYLNRTAF